MGIYNGAGIHGTDATDPPACSLHSHADPDVVELYDNPRRPPSSSPSESYRAATRRGWCARSAASELGTARPPSARRHFRVPAALVAGGEREGEDDDDERRDDAEEEPRRSLPQRAARPCASVAMERSPRYVQRDVSTWVRGRRWSGERLVRRPRRAGSELAGEFGGRRGPVFGPAGQAAA